MTASFHYKDPNAPASTRHYRLGCSAIIRRGDRILLDKRADCGQWALIGGTIENETAEECVRREVLEETGIKAEKVEFFGLFSDPTIIAHYDDGTHRGIMCIFEIILHEEPLLRISDESRALEFHTYAEIKKMDIAATNKPVIDAYFSGQKRPLIQ